MKQNCLFLPDAILTNIKKFSILPNGCISFYISSSTKIEDEKNIYHFEIGQKVTLNYQFHFTKYYE